MLAMVWAPYMSRRLSGVVPLVLAACGSSSPAGPDAPVVVDASPDAPAFVEAPHGGDPQVRNIGGPVLSTPKVVPIFFANDATMQGLVEGFLHALVGSSYWHTTTSEYGIGDLAIEPTMVTMDTPPTTDTALEAWLKSQLDGSHAGWTYDANAIYAVYLPAGVQLSTQFGQSCRSFGGYHSEISGTTGKIVYALMPRCGGGLDGLTATSSHELIEAASDPYPFTQGAYQDTDPDHEIWAFTPGAELGDMCEYVGVADQRMLGTYLVQRTWSNASAAAGHDPCVPSLSTPFRSAAPILNDQLTFDDGMGGTTMTKGVKVLVGTSQTIDVVLFSDAPTDAFPVRAVDVAAALQQQPAELSFSWDRMTGQNGETLHLTITRLKDGTGGGSEFVIAIGPQGMTGALWWAAAGN
jgi:hypothetical protein